MIDRRLATWNRRLRVCLSLLLPGYLVHAAEPPPVRPGYSGSQARKNKRAEAEANSSVDPAEQAHREALLRHIEKLKGEGKYTDQEKARLLALEYDRFQRRVNAIAEREWPVADVTYGSPSGGGAGSGDVFAGASYSKASAYSDGSLGFGFGMGDAAKWVAMQVTVGIDGIFADKAGAAKKIAFEQGGVSIKFHHTFMNGSSLALGKDSIWRWGGYQDTANRSLYGAYSRNIALRRYTDAWFSTLFLSAGVGNHRFVPSNYYLLQDRSSFAPFGAIGLRVLSPVTLILDWNGSLGTAVSVTPLRKTPVVFTLGLNNIAGPNSDEKVITFSGGLGVNFL